MISNSDLKRELEMLEKWKKDDLEIELLIEENHDKHIDEVMDEIDDFYFSERNPRRSVRRSVIAAWLLTRNIQDYKIPKRNTELGFLKIKVDAILREMYQQDYEIVSNHLENVKNWEETRQEDILNDYKNLAKFSVGTFATTYLLKYLNKYRVDTKRSINNKLNNMFGDVSDYREHRNSIKDDLNKQTSYVNRLLRTEASEVRAYTQMSKFKENGYEYYIYVSEADERTCSVCFSLHDQVFKVSEAQVGVNIYPMHPNCRCSTIGVKEIT